MLMHVDTASGPVTFSPQICYEGIIPDFTREGVRLGADFVMNVTNDSWFGNSSEPWIHFAITTFRAIELRTPIVRATNTGFSAMVDITGTVRDRSSLFAPVLIETTLKFPDKNKNQEIEPTFYYRYGEIFGKFAAVLTLLLLLFSGTKYRLKDKH